MKTIDLTALVDLLAGNGGPPVEHKGPEMGYELLNRLAKPLDLPLDCCGVDIHIHIDGPVRVVVHRYLDRFANLTKEQQ